MRKRKRNNFYTTNRPDDAGKVFVSLVDDKNGNVSIQVNGWFVCSFTPDGKLRRTGCLPSDDVLDIEPTLDGEPSGYISVENEAP